MSCPSCGAPIQPGSAYCANCGAKITTINAITPNPAPSYYQPASVPHPTVSTAPYKAIIAVLIIIIILLGVGFFEASAGQFPLGSYHYNLANPPNPQSIQQAHYSSSVKYTDAMWNACSSSPSAGCTMTTTGWREGSVPDTFDYYVSFTSNVNVTVYFFTMGQFIQFSVCNGNIRCVSGSYDLISATTNLPPYTVFKLAEGCSDYLAIYVASGSGTMWPDVGVTHNPSQNTPTGYCLQVGG